MRLVCHILCSSAFSALYTVMYVYIYIIYYIRIASACVFAWFLQEYDYVFDIELDEGSSASARKLKLPYNRSGEC